MTRSALLFLCLAAAAGCGGSEKGAPADPALGKAAEAAARSLPHFIILVQGTFAWMGNDNLPATDALVAGAYLGVRAAISGVANFEPSGTVTMLVVYGDETRLLYGGPTANITADAIGSQSDFGNTITSGLERGLRAVEDRLVEVDARKVLVVIGDGSDALETFDGAAAAERLRAANIEVYTVHYDRLEAASGRAAAAALGASGFVHADSAADIAGLLADIYRAAFAD